MPLDSSSTFAQIKAEYDDTAGYETAGDVDLAKRFLVACRMLRLRLPQRSQHGPEEVEFDPRMLAEEMATARRFIAANAGPDAGGSGVIHSNFRQYRG